MPAIDVQITGLDDALRLIGRIAGAAAKAFLRSSVRLSREGTAYWRSLVTVRTGRMRSSLAVVAIPRGLRDVQMSLSRAEPRGFYYHFQSQRERDQWNAKLHAFLSKRAPAIVRQEIARAVADLRR